MKLRTSIFYTIILLSVISLVGCEKDRTILKEDITIPQDIKGIVVGGSWDVVVVQDEKSSASIEYSAFLEDDILAVVEEDGYLYLGMKNTVGVRRKDAVAYVNAPTIELIKLSGASDADFTGKFYNENCTIDISGSSDMEGFYFTGYSLEIEIGGASDCNMSGEVNNVSLTCNGSSDVKALDLYTNTLDVNINGSSDAKMSVSYKITGSISGASSLEYRGNPDVSEVKLSGASELKQVR
ncbi:DUF2807 domain-containing protein [Bacteroidales bacterium OttesenSCG-928-I14]|nr:DUF2807 domain-containing protein [Bacteroidales bacterium OttesenSCG-928-I14]